MSEWPPELSAADEKGWFRFQRLYDVARSVLRTEDDVRRLVLEAAEDDVHDGGRWLEIQVDPSGYAARFGGITAFTDLVLDCVRDASERTGLGIAVVIAANRTRHPLDARTLARLAAQYAGRGVVGFGLSNDERRGVTSEFAPAFAIAERAGLLLAPHGGELLGPASVLDCLDHLHAGRLGHGVRSVEDPALLDRIVASGVALEVCPVSNVALGVYPDLTSVPLPQLLWRPARRSPWAPTTRCSSAPGWPRSTPPCAPPTRWTTLAWPSWRECRCARPEPPSPTLGAGWPRSTPGRPRQWNDEPVTNPPDPWTPGSDDDLWRQNEEQIAAPQPDAPVEPAAPTEPIAASPHESPAAPAPPTTPYPQPPYSQPPYSQPPYSQPVTASRPQGYGPPAYGQQPVPQPPVSYGAPGYGAPGYAAPGYGPTLTPHPSAQTVMILGLVGLVGSFICGITIFICPFAWIMGGRVRREIDASGGTLGGREQATVGYVCGIIGTVLLVLGALAVVALFSVPIFISSTG